MKVWQQSVASLHTPHTHTHTSCVRVCGAASLEVRVRVGVRVSAQQPVAFFLLPSSFGRGLVNSKGSFVFSLFAKKKKKV